MWLILNDFERKKNIETTILKTLVIRDALVIIPGKEEISVINRRTLTYNFLRKRWSDLTI